MNMSMLSLLAVLLVAAVFAGAWFLSMAEAKRLRARNEDLADRLTDVTAELSAVKERARNLEDAKAAMSEQFQLVSHQAMQASSDSLLKRAEESFVAREKLANSLRRGAGVQGRWGEETLRNVLQAAGLTRFDFIEQQNLDTDEGRRRPDVVVRMPGDKANGVFVIDSKVNLTAFLDSMDALDDEAREAALQRHTQGLRAHVRDLAGKAYWDQFKDQSPDFVALFIPGDGFLAAALDRMPQLMNEAMDKKVIIVTPTTLFALCKAVAYGWRVEDQMKNASHIADLGRELYKRLSVMGGHVSDVGTALGRAVDKYNAFVGSLDSQVLTQAKKFEELQVEHQGKPVPELPPVEAQPRASNKLKLLESTEGDAAKLDF